MRKKKKKIDPFLKPPFAGIEHKLVNSEGFKRLKAHTKWLYVEFRLRYHGNNPRDITFPEREVNGLMDIETFRADYKILIRLGFIDLVKRGGFYRVKHIFGLSKRWEKYGTKDFIEVDVDKLFPKKILGKNEHL
ncbi:hypothetical protein ES705_34652 [subsurface metagenome]